MFAKLRAHEDRHLAIAIEEGEQLAGDLIGHDIADIASMVTQANRRLKARQDRVRRYPKRLQAVLPDGPKLDRSMFYPLADKSAADDPGPQRRSSAASRLRRVRSRNGRCAAGATTSSTKASLPSVSETRNAERPSPLV